MEKGRHVGCQDGEDAIVCTCSDQEEDGLEDGCKAVGSGVDAVHECEGSQVHRVSARKAVERRMGSILNVLLVALIRFLVVHNYNYIASGAPFLPDRMNTQKKTPPSFLPNLKAVIGLS
jgi:hypothetical protein